MSFSTKYSLTGKPLQYAMNHDGGKTTWATQTFEWGTQRLATARVDREEVAGVDQHSTYRYDQAGNVLSVADVSRSGTDNQCFTYDHLRRLTEAWTQDTTTCAEMPPGTPGGPAPYWHSYTYDLVGQRLTDTVHDTTGGASNDVTRAYTYPGADKSQPHTLTSVTTTGPTGTAKDTYGYDEAGNTTTRTLGGDTHTLTWDAEGQLAKVTEPVEGAQDKDTEYLYDADGNRLIGRTSTETTLYLGHTEVTLTQGSDTPKATRYIDLGGGHQAVEEDDGSVAFTLADHHGTAQLAIDAATQELTQRRTLPFGGYRGENPAAWPGTRGFVGGTDDTDDTGLVHLGAREYDPDLARFISVDPLLESDKPQTLGGYTYAAQNPLTFTDPTGMGLACGGAGGSAAACPSRPDGRPGNGRPNEAVDYSKPKPRHPCSSGCGTPPIDIWYKGDNVAIGEVVLPTVSELRRIMPHYSEKVGYQGNLEMWSRVQCGPGNDHPQFCQAAEGLGWFGNSPDLDVLDLLGIREYIDCAQGSGSACTAVLADGAISAATRGIGKGIKILSGALAHGVKRGKSIPLKHLGPCHSFTPETQVLLADGTAKDIEDVQIGDQVKVTDPETGETTVRNVVATITTEDDKHFVDLTITTPDGPATLTPSGHPPTRTGSTPATSPPAPPSTPPTATPPHSPPPTPSPNADKPTTSPSTTSTRTMYSLGRLRFSFTTATLIFLRGTRLPRRSRVIRIIRTR